MNRIDTAIPGVFLLDPKVFDDGRGWFYESYREDTFRDLGISTRFVQDNQSFSSRDVLRGLHYQLGKPQAKLVRVLQGEVFDVAVDVRRGSATFGKWVGEILSGANRRQMYVPVGFAHGFLTLADNTEVSYRMGARYVADAARGVRWDDPRFAIAWPARPAVISERDASYPDVDPELADA